MVGLPCKASPLLKFNFVNIIIAPEAVNHIGWRALLMFRISPLAMGVFDTFFIKEIKRKSLEEIDVLFGDVTAEQRQTQRQV